MKKYTLLIENRKGERFRIEGFSEKRVAKFLKRNSEQLDKEEVIAFNHKEGFVMIPKREITYLCFLGYKNRKKGY